MVEIHKVYLETEEIEQLKAKALSLGISGRGWLSNLLRKIAPIDIVLLDDNVKKIIRLAPQLFVNGSSKEDR